MSRTLKTMIFIDVEIEYKCTAPAREAKLNGLPEDCYPAEPAEFDILSMSCNGIELPSELVDLVAEDLEDEFEEDWTDGY